MIFEVATTLKLLQQSATNSPKLSPQELYNPGNIWVTDYVYPKQFQKPDPDGTEIPSCEPPADILINGHHLLNLNDGLSGCYIWNEDPEGNGTLILEISKGHRLNVTDIKYNLLKNVQDRENIAGFVEDIFPVSDRLPPDFRGDKYTNGQESTVHYQIINGKIVVRYGWNNYTEVDYLDFVNIVNENIYSDENLNLAVDGARDRYQPFDPIIGKGGGDIEQIPVPFLAITATIVILCQLVYIFLSGPKPTPPSIKLPSFGKKKE